MASKDGVECNFQCISWTESKQVGMMEPEGKGGTVPGRGSGQFSLAASAAAAWPVGLLQASLSDDEESSEEEEASFSFRVVLAERAGICRLAFATGFGACHSHSDEVRGSGKDETAMLKSICVQSVCELGCWGSGEGIHFR